jgi:uridine kinase
MPDEAVFQPDIFSVRLYEAIQYINPAVAHLELYEFRYGLDNLIPEQGWASVKPDRIASIEKLVNQRAYYDSIQIKPKINDRIVLDEAILRLTRMLMVGLVTGEYPPDWVLAHFYFDIRGFYFLHRTLYFTDEIMAHFGGKPYRQFEPKQKQFIWNQEIGYQDFKAANDEIDSLFIQCVQKLVSARGTPSLLAIAGPTAAGKTEIVERLRAAFTQNGQETTSLELDNFLTDREYREAHGIFTQGKEALHYDLFKQSLETILRGKKISIPRYDFVFATSSHDLQGNLKPDGIPIEIEPADIIFIEGNFPFLIQETARLIGIKVVYLTEDEIRLKRKWKRDIDYRKKYEPTYFRNRYFKDQFIMAEIAYRPQMLMCDLLVDTTRAALWVTPDIANWLTQ